MTFCTLFPKRNATLISRFFMVTLDQGQWPQVISTKGNAPGSNRQKTYTLPKKERQLSNCLEASSFVKFQRWLALRCLLSVQERWGIFEWGFWQIVIRSIVEMTFGLNSPTYKRKATSEKLCFFWGRVYILPVQKSNFNIQLLKFLCLHCYIIIMLVQASGSLPSYLRRKCAAFFGDE